MKIHIIGCSGSGKTYLARALAKRYDIPHVDLDDIQWDNSAAGGMYRGSSGHEASGDLSKSEFEGEENSESIRDYGEDDFFFKREYP